MSAPRLPVDVAQGFARIWKRGGGGYWETVSTCRTERGARQSAARRAGTTRVVRAGAEWKVQELRHREVAS